MPSVRIEPSPERVIAAFVNAVLTIIREANRR
jgi:hypothetical protein